MELLEAFGGVAVLQDFDDRIVGPAIGKTIAGDAEIEHVYVVAALLIHAATRLLAQRALRDQLAISCCSHSDTA
jgi:hypothetical protein